LNLGEYRFNPLLNSMNFELDSELGRERERGKKDLGTGSRLSVASDPLSISLLFFLYFVCIRRIISLGADSAHQESLVH
jgi:hypothetical protein